MNQGRASHPDPDDFFSDTRMSFGDHLEELRLHLWRAIIGFCIALVLGFFVGHPLLRFICVPVEEQLQIYWNNYYKIKSDEIGAGVANGTRDGGTPIRLDLLFDEQALKQLGVPGSEPKHVIVEVRDPIKLAAEIKGFDTAIRPPTLATLNVQEGFLVYLKVSIVAGFVLSSPWIFYQIWSFIAVGLYPHEKRHVNVFLPFSIGLFLVGVLVCQFLVIPRAISALLWFNEWLEFEPDFRLNEWLSFAILLPVVFGLSFQTPLVMLFLERVGIMSVASYRGKRGIAWFLMAVFAAIILPTYDAYTMLLLWLPMGLLYELGIFLCILMPGRPLFDLDMSESDELIEV